MQLPGLTSNAIWVAVTFGVRTALRLGSNVVLTRLLFPEAFGIMAVINSLRIGMELLTDVGVGQNIVTNPEGGKPAFYNTAWTVQIVRGFVLCLLFLLTAPFVARFYEHMDILPILYVFAAVFIITGFQSTSQFILQKTQRIREFELYSLYCELTATGLMVIAAYFYPSVWVLVVSGILNTALWSGVTHLIPGMGRNRLLLDRAHLAAILSFGKWVFLSSIVFFLSLNYDRLYLAKAIPLDYLGVYGIARSLSDVFSGLVTRITNNVAFPLVSSLAQLPRGEMTRQIAAPRLRFLLLVAAGLAGAFSVSDLIIGLLYDERYAAAAWMVPVLLAGVWFSVLSYFAEAMLVGLGHPKYMAYANAAKLVFLIGAVPLGFTFYGVPGAVMAIASADLPRYAVILPMQMRLKAAFLGQDLVTSLVLISIAAVLILLRYWLGLGSVFSHLAF